MKRKLIIQFVDEESFKIVLQTHFKESFGTFNRCQGETHTETGLFWHDGFFLGSASYPEVRDNGMYLLAYEDEPGSTYVIRSKVWKKRFLEAINAYNKYYGGGTCQI